MKLKKLATRGVGAALFVALSAVAVLASAQSFGVMRESSSSSGVMRESGSSSSSSSSYGSSSGSSGYQNYGRYDDWWPPVNPNDYPPAYPDSGNGGNWNNSSGGSGGGSSGRTDFRVLPSPHR